MNQLTFKTPGKAARDDPKPLDNGSGEEVPENKWEWLAVRFLAIKSSPLYLTEKTSQVIRGGPPAASYRLTA